MNKKKEERKARAAEKVTSAPIVKQHPNPIFIPKRSMVIKNKQRRKRS